MKIFVPAGVKEIGKKRKWFDDQVCKSLGKERDIEFGFQIQGPIDNLNSVRELDNYPFGIHLSNRFSDEWAFSPRRERSKNILWNVSLEHRTMYVLTHGTNTSQFGESEYVDSSSLIYNERFTSDMGAEEYLRSFESMVEFINYGQSIGLPMVLETTAATNFSMRKGIFLPETYLDMRIGNYSESVLAVQERTGCKAVVDIEHSAFACDFAERKHSYCDLLDKIPSNLSQMEKTVIDRFRIFIRKGYVPVVVEPKSLEEEIKAIGAKIYHVNGCFPQTEYMEICDGRVVSHAPILKTDKSFRRYLRIVLDQEPEILVLEVAGADDNHCWSYRRKGVELQKESLLNLCSLLTEMS